MIEMFFEKNISINKNIAINLAAFEILLDIGSTNILSIHAIDYPGVFIIITPNNICFEYWFVPTESTAQGIYAIYADVINEDLMDNIKHYAITTDYALAEKLSIYGFSGYYTFRQGKLVRTDFEDKDG